MGRIPEGMRRDDYVQAYHLPWGVVGITLIMVAAPSMVVSIWDKAGRVSILGKECYTTPEGCGILAGDLARMILFLGLSYEFLMHDYGLAAILAGAYVLLGVGQNAILLKGARRAVRETIETSIGQ